MWPASDSADSIAVRAIIALVPTTTAATVVLTETCLSTSTCLTAASFAAAPDHATSRVLEYISNGLDARGMSQLVHRRPEGKLRPL